MRRILLAENQHLLGAGIESLLAGEPDLDLIALTPRSETELLNDIWYYKPEIIILDEASCLTDVLNLLNLLRDYPFLRVLVVSADDNLVQVYDKQQVLTTSVNKLVHIIRLTKE